MNVFSIDLGGEWVGYAYFKLDPGAADPVLVTADTWKITDRRRTESPGVRWLRFRKCLDDVLAVSGYRPDLVLYEEVRMHMSRGKQGGNPSFNVDAAHVYGAAEAFLLAWCADNSLEVKSVPVASVKRAATGKGGGSGTDKEAILAAARERWKNIQFPDFNASDAAFIGLGGLIELGFIAGPEPPPEKKKAAKKKGPRKEGPASVEDSPLFAGLKGF